MLSDAYNYNICLFGDDWEQKYSAYINHTNIQDLIKHKKDINDSKWEKVSEICK